MEKEWNRDTSLEIKIQKCTFCKEEGMELDGDN